MSNIMYNNSEIPSDCKFPDWGEPDYGVPIGCVYFNYNPDNPNYDYFSYDGKPHCIHVDECDMKRCKNVRRWLRVRGLAWNDWTPELKEEYMTTHKS